MALDKNGVADLLTDTGKHDTFEEQVDFLHGAFMQNEFAAIADFIAYARHTGARSDISEDLREHMDTLVYYGDLYINELADLANIPADMRFWVQD